MNYNKKNQPAHETKWNTIYFEPVELWLNKLNDAQYQSIAKEIRLLELAGNQLRLPHSKALMNGLFELRERHFGLRIYYAFDADRVVILVHAGNKTSQAKDIKRARQLLADYWSDST